MTLYVVHHPVLTPDVSSSPIIVELVLDPHEDDGDGVEWLEENTWVVTG